ncbi:uncharacterized protein LOC121856919 [Homarus americanus]|uniref:uncharacterized protein LOC121856919 n=1 Tax=Homarus americanus TaxID=6706 RepID=UPI001C4603FA|nr:uncharacterized protein LOC121856919 [Homarus americanus]
MPRKESPVNTNTPHAQRMKLAADGDPNQVGRRIVLPATYTGGPRYLHEKRSDAMAFVRHYGRADYFITMTCNPRWPEIVDNLAPGQESHDRPDIVARVFRLKVKKFMEHMKKGKFGTLQAWLYTIAYQKRGLPHAHFLFWIAPEHKIKAEEYDLAISAEIPKKEQDKELHDLVMKHMIHGPCGPLNEGSPCMVDRKCSKQFPKDFLQATEQGNDSYPKYRRRKPEDGGHIGKIKMRQYGRQVEQEITNQWVVPYNTYLLRQFNCHINVEICSSIHSIKYCIKYISKGSDQAVFELQNAAQVNSQEPQVIDEISQYQNMRYVSSSEAAWRILEHPTHVHFPPVVGLAIHLENGQRVLFREENALERAVGPPPPTTLTRFFQLCQDDDFAKTLKYAELPQYYIWIKSTKKWNRRKRGTLIDGVNENGPVWKAPAIGRMYTISPRVGECYFLRLLNEVRGPTSFQDLKIVDGILCTTFREACLARGLLENDDHLRLAMQEARISQSPANMRCLFAIILITCSPSNPAELWEIFKETLSEDYLMQHRRSMNDPDAPVSDLIVNQVLCHLEYKVLMMGGHVLTTYGLPRAPHVDNEQLCREYRRETNYNQEELAVQVDEQYQKLTEDQRSAYTAFLEMVNGEREDHKNIMFLDAPGGTVTRNSNMAKVIRETKAIIVDEAPMAHKTVFEAIDGTLQDITGVKKTMGGIQTLLSGDFRQILPVVKMEQEQTLLMQV